VHTQAARASYESELTQWLQSGKSIFLRSIDNPAISKQYTQHTTQTTVARFSPSGFYVASGDVSGTVKVWDCAGEGATKGACMGRWRTR
jgi:WD40 repeat protein